MERKERKRGREEERKRGREEAAAILTASPLGPFGSRTVSFFPSA
jgi:hypothetical protein